MSSHHSITPVKDPSIPPATDPATGTGKSNPAGKDGCGRTWKIVKYTLLGSAIAIAAAGALLSGLTLAAGIALMFFPGAGTLAGGSLAFLGTALAGAVVVFLDAAAANAGAIAIGGACGLAATAVFVAVTSIASRLFCFRSNNGSSTSGSVSSSEDASEEGAPKGAGSKNPTHTPHGSEEEKKLEGSASESGKVGKGKKSPKKAKMTKEEKKLDRAEKKRLKEEAKAAKKAGGGVPKGAPAGDEKVA